MPEVDETAARPVVAAQPDPPESLPGIAQGALREFARATQKTTIYPMGHPAIRTAIANTLAGLLSALSLRSPLLIGVARRALLLDGAQLPEPSETLEGFAKLLHDLDVAVLEFRAGLRESELETFLVRLREARLSKGENSAALLMRSLEQAGLQSIQIYPIDYAGLTVNPDAAPEDLSQAGDAWSGLVGTIAQLASAHDVALNPEALAASANDRLERSDGVGTGMLRQQVHTLGRRMLEMDKDKRETVRSRLSVFVKALNPTIQKDLLRIDPRSPEDSIHLLADISESLSDELLIEILQNIDRAGDGLHSQFLNVAKKLSKLPSGQIANEKAVDDVLQRWGVNADVMADNAIPARAALREIFQLRESIDCNPSGYQELLQDLTSHELPPVTRTLVSRYGDPSDPAGVLTHAVEIGVQVLNESHNEEHVAGVLSYMGSVTDRLLDLRRYDPIRDAASAARALVTRPNTSEDSHRAATGFLSDFTREERIDRILRESCETGHVAASAESLLALGGHAAFERIVELLESDVPTSVAAGLRSVAVSLGPETLQESVTTRWEGGWAKLRCLFPLFRAFPATAALPTLEKLFRHEESRVRREALAYLCDLDPSQGSTERHLRRAIADHDSRLVAFAIRRLGDLESERGDEILAAMIRGSITGTPPADEDLVRRAVLVLRSRGEPGVRRLSQSLLALCPRLLPCCARAGSVIAMALAEDRQDPSIARSLRVWRLSIAGMLSVFFRPREGRR